MRKLKAIDLFAGIGGMRLGFERSGFDFVYSNDFDAFACQTYRTNFKDIDERDIKDVEAYAIPDFDVLLGGFPCQPFSMIGKRKGLDDERAKSFFHIIKILAAKKPRAFLLENVKHLKLYDGGKVYQRIKNNLEWAGYKVKEAVLDSKDFGVAQHRERLYIIGFLDHSVDFKFPEPSGTKVAVSSILEKSVPEDYYLSERLLQTLLRHKERHISKGNGFGCSILDKKGTSNTIVAGNMGRERNLIKDRKTSKNKMGIRTLTVRECARLQGFPDDFVFPVSKTRAYHQIGNAVTVNVAGEIAKEIRKILLPDEQTPSSTVSPALGELMTGEIKKTTSA